MDLVHGGPWRDLSSSPHGKLRRRLTSGLEKGNICAFGGPLSFSFLQGSKHRTHDRFPDLALGFSPDILQVAGVRGANSSFSCWRCLRSFGKKGDIYNILWALVFGFATLNILGLVARRFEPNRNRLNFGETIAIMVVIVSILLLGWEMLNLFKIFPIKLHPHD